MLFLLIASESFSEDGDCGLLRSTMLWRNNYFDLFCPTGPDS